MHETYESVWTALKFCNLVQSSCVLCLWQLMTMMEQIQTKDGKISELQEVRSSVVCSAAFVS